MNLNTEKFVHDVSTTFELDYGDFMRKANGYLSHLRQELAPLNDQSINNKIREMQRYLLYNPSGNVNATLDKLITDAKYIEDLLHGHDQDWESEVH
ncbi:MAG: hypothetical protein BroJett040_10260 [Oligoflexia bacterium]|nr:MAG: hypothetical protein BroJett040_10260 [Oligoflexia bacterium]